MLPGAIVIIHKNDLACLAHLPHQFLRQTVSLLYIYPRAIRCLESTLIKRPHAHLFRGTQIKAK